MKKSLLLHLPGLLGALALATSATAQTTTWTGTNDGDWFNPANWSTGVVPTSDDTLKIDNGQGPVISGSTVARSGTFWIASEINTSGALTLVDDARLYVSGTLDMSSGTNSRSWLLLKGNSQLNLDYGAIITSTLGLNATFTGTLQDNAILNVAGALTMSSGTNSRSTLLLKDNSQLNLGGGGVLGNATGASFTGTLTDNARLTFSGALTIGYTGTSSLTLSGNTLLKGASLNLGRASNNNSKGMLILTENASAILETLTVGNYRGAGFVQVTDNARLETKTAIIGLTNGESSSSSTGTVTISGSARWYNEGVINVGNYYTGILNIQNHAVVTSGSIVLGAMQGVGSNGPPNSMYGRGTINLIGDAVNGRGVLETGAITSGAAVWENAIVQATIAFNGGILRATSSNDSFIMNGVVRGLAITTTGQGAYIDTNGFDIGITKNPLSTYTVTMTGTGNVTKLGAGTLAYNFKPNYTGTTIIREGTLKLTEAQQLVYTATTGGVFSSTATGLVIDAGASVVSNNLSQSFLNLSGAGTLDIGNGVLRLDHTAGIVTAFSGNITARNLIISNLGTTTVSTLTLSGSNVITGTTILTTARVRPVLFIDNDHALGTSELHIQEGVIRTNTNVTLANNLTTSATDNFLANIAQGKSITFTGTVSGTNSDPTATVNLYLTGGGTLTFAGDSSKLAGGVSVGDNSTLLVSGLGEGRLVTMSNLSTFGGKGTVKIAEVSGTAANTTIQLGLTHNNPHATASATLTITSTLTTNNTKLAYDTYASNTSDLLEVAALHLYSPTLTIDLAQIRQGTYTLLRVTGDTPLDTALPANITTTRSGTTRSARENVSYALSGDQKSLILSATKTNEKLVWDASGGDLWDYNRTASWGGGGDTVFVDGDRILFDSTDTAGTRTIDIERNGVTASDITITGGASYTFTGSGYIATDATSLGTKGATFGAANATGKLTMQGTGTLTLANRANAFHSGLDILAGTVVGSAASLGKDTAITNASALVFDQSTTDTFDGTLTGAGTITKTGAGTVILTATNSAPAGAITARQGALLLGPGAKLGSSTVTVRDTATFGGSGSAANIRVETGGSLQTGLGAGGTDTLTLASVSLAHNARLTGSGTLNAPIAIDNTNTAIADIATGDTLHIAQTISGEASLEKQGAGTLIFTKRNTYTGPTTITAGTLGIDAPDILSPDTPCIIKTAGTLDLRGHAQTLHTIINEGRIHIGAPAATAGNTLTITGNYTAVAGAGISLNLLARDNTATLADRLVFAPGSTFSGPSNIYINIIDQRANTNAYESFLNDIPALIVNENGDIPADAFKLDDGQGRDRIVIGIHDYRLYTHQNEARLVAVESAEVPASLAINPISLAVNRATLNSLGQHLDYLHDLHAAENPGHRSDLWLQTYYRRDCFYGDYWSDTAGAQLGYDKSTEMDNGGTVTYGAYVDYTYSKIDLYTYNSPNVKLISKSLGAYMALQHNNWATDLVLKYSWDDYTINVADTPEFDTDGASWGGFIRVSYLAKLKHNWSIVPQGQFIFQARGVNDATDAYGRTYSFGEKYARPDKTNSLESRIGLSARQVRTLKNGKTFRPYFSLFYVYDFRGDMTVTVVNKYKFADDLGGGSYLVNLGMAAQLGKRLDAVLDLSGQTGGKIDSYSINAGLNYRW